MLALRTFLRDQGWFDERGIAIAARAIATYIS